MLSDLSFSVPVKTSLHFLLSKFLCHMHSLTHHRMLKINVETKYKVKTSSVPVNRINFCLSLKDQSSVLVNLKRRLLLKTLPQGIHVGSTQLDHICMCHSGGDIIRIFIGWFVAPQGADSDDIVICCLNSDSSAVKYSLRITPELAWSLTFQGTLLKKDQSPLLNDHPAKLSSVDDIDTIIIAVNGYQICDGNSDESFITLSQARANKGCFFDASGR